MSSIRDILGNFRIAKKRAGKSALAQFAEIVMLRFGAQKLSAFEYFDFHLYDDTLYDWEQKCQFVGWRRRLYQQSLVNDERYLAIAFDKIIFQNLIEAFGLPIPKIKLVFSPEFRNVGAIPTFSNSEHFIDFLRSFEGFPIFGKPVDGFHGRNVFGLEGYDSEIDSFRLSNGNTLSADCLMHDVIPAEKYGYLFQEKLTQHPELRAIAGNAISSLRIWTLLRETGPEIYRCIWRVANGNNMYDNSRHNSRHGSIGNPFGTMNPKTGEVLKQFLELGFWEQEITHHPDTGAPLTGFNMPLWDDVVDLVKSATQCLPGLRMQAWDIAITPDGPSIVELSLPGDIDSLQAAFRQGHWDHTFDGLLEDIQRYAARQPHRDVMDYLL